MDHHFATAMSRALEQTRAGNPGEAARIIQAALAGERAAPGTVRPDDTAAPRNTAARSDTAPPAGKPPRKGRKLHAVLSAGIEEAEVVEVHPPRRSAAPFAARPPVPDLKSGQGDLQRMMDSLGSMMPQGLSGLPQGLSGLSLQGLPGMGRTGAQPEVPAGARYETRSFASAHGSRDYRLFVPSTVAAGPRGLVLMLHGCTQDADDFACGTDMNTHAEQNGLIVVYPHQSRAHNAQGCWNWFRPEDQGADAGEPALLAALTREVAAEFAVPQGAVFAAGLSAGGAMAATLAATEPGLFTAVGIHSGLPHAVAHDVASAFGAMRGQGGKPRVSGPSSARTIVFHGTADATVHPSNGEALVAAAGTGLRGTSRRETGKSAGGRSYVRESVVAPDGTPLIELWRIEGAGHAWSGGRPEGSYTDPAGPEASAEMIRFFLHPRP